MDIPADSVPPELKAACEQVLKRARELRKVDPVMSYWCCFSAATACMKVPTKRSDESMKFLLNLVTLLEDMKKQLLAPDSDIEHVTINDESAGSAYVEDFAMRVFIQADDEDRAGKSNKRSIRKFMVASQFLEVLRCFEPPNGMREELEQKQQYAKWKATDIAKALREGRKPMAGPPLSEEEAAVDHMLPGEGAEDGPSFPTLPSLDNLSTSPPEASGTRARPIDIPPSPEFGPVPGRQDSGGSGTWSTAATPGLRDGDDSEKFFPSTTASSSGYVYSDRGNASSDTAPEGSDGPGGSGPAIPAKKGVRFAGPDGAPLSPPSTILSVDSYTAPKNPPPSEFEDEEDTRPATARQFTQPLNKSPASASPLPTTPSAPSVPLPSTPYSAPIAPPAHPPLPSRAALPQSLGTKSIEQCQKHAKWAVSALDYEDLDTARLELRKALALLGVPT